MSRSKDIGTRGETAVVRVLRQLGFPQAERRALRGAIDAGDITGTPGVLWEVKAGEAAKTASDTQIDQWMIETFWERRRDAADVGVLVVQRKGVGLTNAHRWHAYIHLGLLEDLHHPGWPNPDRWQDTAWTPVRMQLSHLCTVLVQAGYGTRLLATSDHEGDS